MPACGWRSFASIPSRVKRALAGALLAAALAVGSAAAGTAAAETLDLGRVTSSRPIERTISIANPAAATLELHKVALSPGLRVLQMPRTIEPGGNAELTLRFDPSRLRGRYAGAIGIYTSEHETPRVIEVQAEVVTPIEFRSEEHTSELQSQSNLVCRLLLE